MEETQYLNIVEKKPSVEWTDKSPIVTVTQPIQMTGRPIHDARTRYFIFGVSLGLLFMTALMTVLTYAHLKKHENERDLQFALIVESFNAPERTDLQDKDISVGEKRSYKRITKRQSSNPCVSDCTNVTDGDYPSCNGCDLYVTCSSTTIYTIHDNRPCPSGLVWDDSLKRCEFTSTTCFTCITTCTGQSNGDYQSCNGCNVYATCSNEIMYNDRPCPASLVWDDTAKRCEYTSTTCA